MVNNSKDPLKRFIEKEAEMEEASPMNPPDAFAPTTVEPVAYKDMAPFLQKFIDEHKVCINVLNDFDSALNSWKGNGWIFNDDINENFKKLFSFLDNNATVHNRNEEKVLFPMLHKRLLETDVADTKKIFQVQRGLSCCCDCLRING
jgi:hypothetical protein